MSDETHEIPDAERLREIADLLKYESSIAFYSHRAKESMLMLLAEAHRAAEMRMEILRLERKAEILGALQSAGVDSWDGYDIAMEALRD